MMLKKFKILMLIIILSLMGIVSVISIWLYGSYTNRLEITTNEVERSLFNSVQKYYERNTQQDQKKNYRDLVEAEFIRDLKVIYPAIDSLKIKDLLDSFWRERYSKYHNNKGKNEYDKGLVPPFMLQQVSFDANALSQIDRILQVSLRDKGIAIDVDVVREQIMEWPKGKGSKVALDSLGMINTRPILVNPADHYFLKVKFKPPVLYILSKMFWQLTVALLLIIGLSGTFVYLLWTINQQNKLALLRKSFVNNMTHELKTPVAIVMAAIEAIQRYGAKDDKVKMERYLTISQKELAHLSSMIEKVLQLDMDEINGLVLDREQMDVVLLLEDIAELNKLGTKKEVSFNFHTVDKSLIINADPSHLKNVFSNLFDNAIKYSGEIVQIDVTIEKKDNLIVFTITDHGIGIDSKYQSNVFDMFFRVPNGELHTVKGFGLGLAYVKQIVEQHDGTIRLVSELNKGTTFTVSLPQ